MLRFFFFSALFLLLTLAVSFSWTTAFDEVFLFQYPSFFEVFLPLFSPLATFFWLALVLLLLGQKGQRFALAFFFLFLTTLVLEIIFKTGVPTEEIALYPPLPFMEGTYPSGHILRGTLFLGLLIALGYSKALWLLLLLQALAMLAVEGHTMSDLIGGYLLAASAITLFFYRCPDLEESRGRRFLSSAGYRESSSPKREDLR